MNKNSKVMQMAAMAMALGGLPGMNDLLGGTHEPKAPKDPNDGRVAKAPKDPNDGRVAKAEAKRQRKAAKRQADLIKQQLGNGTYQVPE